MKHLGINKAKIAKETGFNYSHVRDSTVPKNFNRWLKFTLWVFDEMIKIIDGLKKEIEELKEPIDFMPPVSWKYEPKDDQFDSVDIHSGTAHIKPKDEKK